MSFQRLKITAVFAALVFFGGCGDMGDMLSSTGTYKVNSKINGMPLEELSIASYSDKIKPFFEISIADDPDVTALMVYFKNTKGEIASYKIIYELTEDTPENLYEENSLGSNFETVNQNEPEIKEELQNDIFTEDDTNENESENNLQELESEDYISGENENILTEEIEEEKTDEVLIVNDKTEKPEDVPLSKIEIPAAGLVLEDPLEKLGLKIGDEYVIPVSNFDKDLPDFPLPAALPIGKYKVVFSVFHGETVIHTSEKDIFYISNAVFSFNGIQLSLPSASLNSKSIPAKTMIMLETKLNFNSKMEPYIVWYNGDKIIREGSFSDGENMLLLETPKQNGFFSLYAEVFPFADRHNITGYKKRIAPIVSSKHENVKVFSAEEQNLLHKYLFEGDLTDSVLKIDAGKFLKPLEKSAIQWISFDGVYGLAAGHGRAFSLPDIIYNENEGTQKVWRIVSRFKLLNEGEILSVQFGSNHGVKLNLINKDSNLVLTSFSSDTDVSKNYALSANNAFASDRFINTEIVFSISAKKITATLNLIDTLGSKIKTSEEELSIETETKLPHKIIIGSINTKPVNEQNENEPTPEKLTAIWDELSVFNFQDNLLKNIYAVKEYQKLKETETPTDLTAEKEKSENTSNSLVF